MTQKKTDSGSHEPDGGCAAEGAEVSELDSLKAQLAANEKQLTELQDKYLRALAEAENVRKRLRQQNEENLRHQREGLLRDFLLIIDNLERAIEAARGGGNGKSIVEGVEMVLASILEYLRSHGVDQMSAVGQPFDPTLHEAVDHVESARHVPNTVIDEFNRGYRMGERILRPARVSVAKAPGSKGPEGQ